MQLNRFRIYDSKLLLAAMLLLLVEPSYFKTLTTVDLIYTIGKYACFVLVLGLVLCRKKLSSDLVWTLGFFGIQFICTLMNQGSCFDYLKSIIGNLTICMIFCLWLEKNPDTLLDAFGYLEIYVYINFVTLLMYPSGMYNSGLYSKCWFLGFKNPQVRIILPILCMSLIHSYRTHAKISLRAYILIVCSALTMSFNGSTTGLVGVGVFIILLWLFHRKYKRLPAVLTLENALIVIGIGFAGILFFRIQEYFSFFIVGILGEDLDFMNRVGIWNRALQLIQQKLWVGYGYLSEAQFVELFNNREATHPHNYFFYILMNGGIILLGYVIYGYLRADKKINASIDTVYSKIILFVLIAFMVMGISESLVSTMLLYPMLILGMKTDVISGLEYQNVGVRVFGRRLLISKKHSEKGELK